MRTAFQASSALLLLSLFAQPPAFAGERSEKGAFTCDFAIPLSFPLDQLAPVIERDRMFMMERPGNHQKHIPIALDPVNAQILSGGRYLIDTPENAAAYFAWVKDDFVLDGVHFLERPYFLEPECHWWEVLHADDLGDVRTTQEILRTERWALPPGDHHAELEAKWPSILAAATQRGLSSVWLLYQPEENFASLVYFRKRILPKPVLDAAGLLALQLARPLGAAYDGMGWTRTFDRTQWALTIWFPFVAGDHGEPSLWPHSPPLPEPACGDSVCEASRGETHDDCAADCAVHCGDALCQPDEGEDTSMCPGDCRI